ncbi:unnamed protein product [Orchesella dallaii]|uniref:Uncharacterized protein n=1 Tax=Orchesella dallaii TaxID=48710 RepID=A0ABP1RFW9_9HEXA
MCLKFTKAPFVAVIYIGIYLTVFFRDGVCDETSLLSTSQDENNSKTNQHVHSWKGWADWLPSESKHDHGGKEYIPLSPSEQTRIKRSSTGQSKKNSSGTRSSKSVKDKTANALFNEGDLRSIKQTVMNFATTVMNHFLLQRSSSSSIDRTEKSIRNGRVAYLENLGNRQDGPNVGKPEREAERGVIDWLARLIGVQGKTLGEFLREYQVHVLYDLAFTFFKWIFFLYAGLLIP